MLPAHLADNIRRQVLYYLQSTFDFRDERVASAFERFREDPSKASLMAPGCSSSAPFAWPKRCKHPQGDRGLLISPPLSRALGKRPPQGQLAASAHYGDPAEFVVSLLNGLVYAVHGEKLI